jgi:dienelactone hydrolase
MTLDIRGKSLIDYKRELRKDGAENTLYIVNKQDKISFMETGDANFSYLDHVPNNGNDLIFECKALITYPSLIRRYNFKKRGEQFVNVLMPVSDFMPPLRQIISMTSIGRDTIEIEGRKINCERLVFELKNRDLISVWITRGFRNVLMIEMPKYGFKAVLCAEKKDISVEEYSQKSELYTETEVSFENEGIALCGTLSTPNIGEGPHPAIILIWDSGAMDRNALGIFTDIAHAIAEAGYCVLRFDKRGIGKSGGFHSTYDQSEVISDLKYAIDFLRSRPEVDGSCVGLLGHSEGGFYASYLNVSDEDLRACIIMSALSSLSPLRNNCQKLKILMNEIAAGDEEYVEAAVAAVKKSREMIKDKGDWIMVLDKGVFTKKMNLEEKYDILDITKKINVPVFILHGRKDNINIWEEAEELADALAAGGNDNLTTIYFGELGHFFGAVVKNPPIRDHIEVDIEVLKNITTWLDKNLCLPTVEAPDEPTVINIETYELEDVPEEKEEVPSSLEETEM